MKLLSIILILIILSSCASQKTYNYTAGKLVVKKHQKPAKAKPVLNCKSYD